MPDHPIFDLISNGDLEAVKTRVVADPTVLERRNWLEMTPLICSIWRKTPAIAQWLIEKRGAHDVDTLDANRMAAIHYASLAGDLALVQALTAAGACPSRLNNNGSSLLTFASTYGHVDVAAHLLTLSAARATLDIINRHGDTALSCAAAAGHAPIIQLLLEANADPTIPAGDHAPLSLAALNGHADAAALLRAALAGPDRARSLHKARALLDAARGVRKAQRDAVAKGLSPTLLQRAVLAVTPEVLKPRVAWARDLPQVELAAEAAVPAGAPQRQRQRQRQRQQRRQQRRQQQGQGEGEGEEARARVRATVAFAVGLGEEEEEEHKHLPPELFKELLGYLLPSWGDKGPEGVGGQGEGGMG